MESDRKERRKIITYCRMKKPGEAVLLTRSRRGRKNSQAKGPVLDETPESEYAPKRQSAPSGETFRLGTEAQNLT